MASKHPKKPPTSNINVVHKDTVHFENVKKEMKYLDKNRTENF